MSDSNNSFLSLVAFVGLPNVGKSTLLNSLIGAKIAPTTKKPQTTRRIIRGIITDKSHQLVFFDTPGLVRKTSHLHQFMYGQIFLALENVDQVALIVDATDNPKRNINFIKIIKEKCLKNNQSLFLVLNKIDKIKDKKILLEKIDQYIKEADFESVVPISAEKGDGLNNLLEEFKKKAKPMPFIFGNDSFTDASESEIVSELIREKAMLQLKDELPYKIAVTIESFDESRRENQDKPLIKIDAVIHVERKSQKAIVLGSQGQAIKQIGIKSRVEIERLLQCQVMLKLFVRVEPQWTTSSKSLKKLGY